MAKKKQAALPKTIYAVRKHDGEMSWLDAQESMNDLNDPDAGVQLVGTYQLVEQGELQSVTQYQRKR